jgi:Cu/Ag efflux protein CusF
MKGFMALLLAFVLACSASGPESRGVVVAVDRAKGEITLDHEEIPGLMTAMTMTFHADPGLLAGIEAGQQVGFRVREEGAGHYVVTAIEPRRP